MGYKLDKTMEQRKWMRIYPPVNSDYFWTGISPGISIAILVNTRDVVGIVPIVLFRDLIQKKSRRIKASGNKLTVRRVWMVTGLLANIYSSDAQPMDTNENSISIDSNK